MAASPVSISPTPSSLPTADIRRRQLALTQRRLEANRRNAARSSGPRTSEGKARVARNAIKHGFFVAHERWSPGQRRDFAELLTGLRDDLQPHGVAEESCVAMIAESYVRMAALLRYENIAALEYHQRRDRELTERVAAAEPDEAARMEASREELRRAGLWRPTIPGPREAGAIIRYEGKLDRAIRAATSRLEGLKKMRLGGASWTSQVQKQTHSEASPTSVLRPGEGAKSAGSPMSKAQKQSHYSASPSSGLEAAGGPQMAPSSDVTYAKTNPLSSMFTGNRHQRRRAKAIAARQR